MALITVAVGILTDDEGRVLVTRRAASAHQGGLWEFPGGKVESGESVIDALARELKEELGLEVEHSEPFMVVDHDYGDKQVRLEVCRVLAWRGAPRGLEGQPMAWQPPAQLRDWAFPAANVPILAGLLAD